MRNQFIAKTQKKELLEKIKVEGINGKQKKYEDMCQLATTYS